jgi:uncharacterized protein (TIGR02285 family)
MKKSIFIIFLILFCGYTTNIEAQQNIHWFTDSVRTSNSIAQKANVPLSITADTTRLLMSALPQYKFDIEFAQSPSIARLLNKLPNSCAPNRVKTPERLKNNIYSLPLNIALGLRLYLKQLPKSNNVSKGTFDDEQQSISLASLFTGKSTYTLGIEKGRSYGVFLDNQIVALDKHNLVIRSGEEATSSLVKMLLKDRIEYMIEYPIGINETLNNIASEIRLNSLRITGSPDYILGYIACHKGTIGKKIIDDINVELQKLYRSYSFYLAHIRHLDKADLEDFNQAYQVIFKVAIPIEKSH